MLIKMSWNCKHVHTSPSKIHTKSFNILACNKPVSSQQGLYSKIQSREDIHNVDSHYGVAVMNLS